MIKNLVISGGGFRTIPIIGTLKLLEDKNILKNVKNFYGTSAGGIYCLLLLLEYTVEDIKNIIFKFDVEKILEPTIDIDNFLTHYNIYDHNKFIKLIKLLINYKLNGKSNITLHQLYILTNKVLTCTTVSLKQRSVKYFNHINQPNLPVYKLIMMTCAIPFVFKPVSWRDDKYIDGGIIDNFPVFPIPSDEIEQTLGIRSKVKLKIKEPNFDDIYDYLNCLYSIITMSVKNVALYNIITVTLSEKYSSNVVSMDIKPEIREKILEQSYKTSEKQFNNFEHLKYVNKPLIKRRNSF